MLRSTYVITAILAATLAGADAGAEPLRLREAVNIAIEKNLLVQTARFEYESAVGSAFASGSRYLPRVFLEERATVTNSATRAFMMQLDEGRFSLAGDLNHPKRTSDFQSSIVLEQPLFDMNIGNSVAGAREEKAVREIALEQRMDAIAFQVYEAYLGVQRSKARLELVERELGDTREHMRLAMVRSAVGVGLKYDELRIKTHQAEVEQQKVTAENDYALARLRLGKVMGLDAGTAPDIGETVKALEIVMNTADLEQVALRSRKDINAQKAVVAKNDAAVAAAKGAYWPTIYGMASYQANDRDIPFGRDNDSWVVGATLRWELFDGMRRTNEVHSAQAGRNAASSYLRNLQQEASYEVREGILRREEAAKRVVIAKNALVEAEEMVRLITRRFENALATTVELLDAETAVSRARLQLADNESNYALAAARVYHSAGLLLKEIAK